MNTQDWSPLGWTANHVQKQNSGEVEAIKKGRVGWMTIRIYLFIIIIWPLGFKNLSLKQMNPE